MKKKIFTTLLVVLLLALAIVMTACSEDKPTVTTAGTTTEGGAVTTTAPATTTAAPTDIIIADKTECYFNIVYPAYAQSPVSNAADSLTKSIFEKLGKNVKTKKDTTAETELEILIGETTREASANGAEGLALNQYKIAVVGKKIVISAGCDNALVAAVTALKEAYFDTATDKVAIPADLLIEGSIPMKETTSVKAGKWNPLTFKASNGVALLYQIYLPKGYDPAKEYPCILYMHSAGVTNSDNSHIYQGEAEFLNILRTNKYNDKAVIIAPACPTGSKWVPVNAWNEVTYDFTNTDPTKHMVATLELLEYYQGELSIDDNRLYTYGMSMGGFAVWDLLARNPGKFAAAIPVAGAGDPTTAYNMGDTAIWIFHGKLDDVVPVTSSLAMLEALKDAGRTDVKYTEFPDLMHGIWGATANTEGLIDWMFEQTLAD